MIRCLICMIAISVFWSIPGFGAASAQAPGKPIPLLTKITTSLEEVFMRKWGC